MTKEEILNNALNGLETIDIAKQFILKAMEEYANLRLSEQKEKHDKEMEEFAEWLDKDLWVIGVNDRLWYGQDTNKGYTFTELLTKFKNR